MTTFTPAPEDGIGRPREERTCDYCGRTEKEVGEISYHSGSLECWPCWNWRKLDGPAADHWAPIFKKFLSNIDFHDATKFFPETLGISTEEFGQLITLVQRAHVNCDHALALREDAFKAAIARAEAREAEEAK